MRVVEAAWLARPRADLADAWGRVKLAAAARQRLVQIEAPCRRDAPSCGEGAGDGAGRERRH